MASASHTAAADLLASAYRTGLPVEPLTDRYPTFTLEDAYQVQLQQVRRWKEKGRRIVGHKVGLTSAAMQRQLGVDQPDSGVLFADAEHSNGSLVDVRSFLSPRIEPEIAFVLGATLQGPGVTVAEAATAVSQIRASLEIIDSRIADWRITLVDTVADNASCGGYVLGDVAAWTAAPDLADVEATMTRNGSVAAVGTGAAVLGSPLNALVWLANTLGERGVTLQAGEVILPGSMTAAIPVAPGDTVEATFAGIGTVGIGFY